MKKNYSVAEFKKDKKLLDEWAVKCGWTGNSKNCENARLAAAELDKEHREKAPKKARKAQEQLDEAFEAEMQAEHEKRKAEFEKRQAEKKAKE